MLSCQCTRCELSVPIDARRRFKLETLRCCRPFGMSTACTDQQLRLSEQPSRKARALVGVQQDGYALAGLAEELKGDREIVLTAVRESAAALEYASKHFQGERGRGPSLYGLPFTFLWLVQAAGASTGQS
eukprot:6221771-Amphidinium_carterae.1